MNIAARKITIVGAGPAGLYLAILLKKADRRHEITVLERNPPDTTFGFGVVFSEGSLAELREADGATHTEIVDNFVRWDRIDVHYEGELLRSRGHGFSAIARTRLLDILQRRCEELGVKLCFGVAVTDASTVDGDLVVAADGVNSGLRRASGDAFGTVIRPQGCKYVWFGTDLVFDAFTFVFKRTEYGLFQAHAYPYDEHRSTFIVECAEPTWRAAGLDGAGEGDSLTLCQELFAGELAGRRLLSNRSVWLSFQRVSNSNWHHGSVVLVGDAAHTAHFSIGSGTKLAMEDSIALADALARHPADLTAALVAYELQRQPAVERFQQAADTSAEYFVRTATHRVLPAIPFAVNLLTRSGRLSHAGLTARDPAFGQAVDAWFAGAGGTAIAPPPAFAPLRLRARDARNRVVQSSTVDALGTVAGGAGIVLGELVAIRADGRITPATPAIADLDLPAAVARAHRAGALLALQIGHAGARGATRAGLRGVDLPLPAEAAWPLIAASALPFGPFGATPHAMQDADLAEIRQAFAAAAARAGAAGVDLLELDMAHGRLLAGFLSPLTNRRDDRYGGALSNRLRFPLQVVDAVRAEWPADRPLAVRLTAADWDQRRGLTVADGITAARQLAAHGVDLVHVEAGQSIAEEQPEYRRGFLTELSDRIRNEAGVTTLVGGYLTTLDEVNTIVAAGRADLCLVDVAGGPT